MSTQFNGQILTQGQRPRLTSVGSMVRIPLWTKFHHFIHHGPVVALALISQTLSTKGALNTKHSFIPSTKELNLKIRNKFYTFVNNHVQIKGKNLLHFRSYSKQVGYFLGSTVNSLNTGIDFAVSILFFVKNFF